MVIFLLLWCIQIYVIMTKLVFVIFGPLLQKIYFGHKEALQWKVMKLNFINWAESFTVLVKSMLQYSEQKNAEKNQWKSIKNNGFSFFFLQIVQILLNSFSFWIISILFISNTPSIHIQIFSISFNNIQSNSIFSIWIIF